MKKNIASIAVFAVLIALLANSGFIPDHSAGSMAGVSENGIVTLGALLFFLKALGEVFLMFLPYMLMSFLIFMLVLRSSQMMFDLYLIRVMKRQRLETKA